MPDRLASGVHCRGNAMNGRIVMTAVLSAGWIASAQAQDVPGIEICTVEKTMERRTSCLQSNVDFLHKTIGKLALDHQQKLDAANRQIEALKATVIALQKSLAELQAAKSTDAPTTKDAPRAKDSTSAKDVPPTGGGAK
jgi:hypothetical protein